MAKVMITEQYLEDIADAIRAKLGGSDTYSPGEMATAISLIDGGSPTISSLNVTPSTSEQTFNSSSVDGYKPVVVAAMSTMTLPTSAAASATSGYTSKATISRSTSDQYINIPTGYNSAGAYYKINAVANGSATGPSSLSASSATVSTGTNTVTFTKTGVTTTPTVSAGYVSSATASTATVSLTASINTRSSSDLSASNLTVTAPSGYYANAATKTLSDANLIAGNIKKDVTIFGTTGTYEGSGGGSSMIVATATKTLTSAASSISFTGLGGEPTSFAITSSTDQTTGGTKAVAVTYDGTNLYGMDITTQAANDTGFSKSYSNGTLTITATTASFQANEYKLVYSYGGTAANIGTEEVQVGSGATSITFTGLEDEPEYFSVIFQSTFSTSSGYQRVMDVVYDGTSDYGNALDSSAKHLTSWSHSYSSGSLTVSSTSTNNGGYFHQPGYYRLIYAIGGDSSLQKKTVTPTSSDQTVTADTAQGYTALSQVKVEGVTCSNLTAGNIKSGVTVKIGTATDDDSVTSVIGTYDAGGGSSLNTQVLQQGATRVAGTSYAKACGDLTVSVAGTYDVYWTTYRTSTSGTWGTRLYKNSSALSAEQTTFSSYYQTVKLTEQVFAKNDVLSVYAKTRGSNYYAYVGQLTIVQTS